MQIWNDTTGERVEVGPDSDGLGLVNLQSHSDTGQLLSTITMTQECALLLAKTIQNMYSAQANQKDNQKAMEMIPGSVTSEGLLLLPIRIRKTLDIEQGGSLSFVDKGDGVVELMTNATLLKKAVLSDE